MKRALGIIFIILILGGGYYFFSNQKFELYNDSKNKISLEKPKGWMAGSIDGYARVAQDTTDLTKPNVLIKIDYPESIIPSLGLDTAGDEVVGGKTVQRIDHEWETKDPATGKVNGKQTFTFLMWTAPSGKKIIFEITPWQQPTMSPEVEQVVRTFTPHE